MNQDIRANPNHRPPEDVSQRLQGAIHDALAEEKKPRSTRYLKIGFATMLSTALLTVPIALLFREQLGWVWKLAAIAWAACFLIGFSLHFHPQPRLTVPGYWSPSIVARILIIMTFLTGVQILLCPSFVFLDSPLGWAPFAPITDMFMAWGGMRACMLSCGFIFSSLGALVTFLSIEKVLSRSVIHDLIRAAGLAFLTQGPVIAVQVFDENLRPFAPFWALGSALGLVVIIFLIRVFAGVIGRTR